MTTCADGTCDCRQVKHHASQSVLGTPARQSVLGTPSCRSPHPAHIYTIKVLPSRAEDCAARGTVRAARHPARRTPRTACAAWTRTLRPDCSVPRKQHTPHVNPSRRASPLPSWRGRQSDDPAALLWAGGGESCGGGAHGPSSLPAPPSYTYKHWQARSACLSALIATPRPCPAPPPQPMRRCRHAVDYPALQPPPDPCAHPSHPPSLLLPQFPPPPRRPPRSQPHPPPQALTSVRCRLSSFSCINVYLFACAGQHVGGLSTSSRLGNISNCPRDMPTQFSPTPPAPPSPSTWPALFALHLQSLGAAAALPTH